MGLAQSVLTMVARGIVRLIDDSEHTQFVQVEGNGAAPADDVEHHQPYGFASHPPPGSTALVLMVGGAASHPVVINAFHPEKRAKGLAEGEVGLYDHQGRLLVVIKAGDAPEIRLGDPTATEPVVLQGPMLTQLNAIKATLDSLTGQASFTVPYAGPGTIGAQYVKAK